MERALNQRWDWIVTADFFIVEVGTGSGLARFLVLFLIDLSTRCVEIAGITTKANGIWMTQVARNFCDDQNGFLTGKRYLIHDRDPLFTAEFQETPAASGVKSVKLPLRSPNLNPHAERFVRTIKESCLNGMILFGEGSLRKTVREFMAHWNTSVARFSKSNSTAGTVFSRRGQLIVIWPTSISGSSGVFTPVIVDSCAGPLLQEEIGLLPRLLGDGLSPISFFGHYALSPR